mgnify:CR=1 FL=1
MKRSFARRLAPAVVLLAATVGISACSNSNDDAKTPGNTEVATGGERFGTADAETAPLREPEAYGYDFDLAAVTEVWRRGSVISSWLLDLSAQALAKSPGLADFSGRVSDSGEGRWTLQAAIDEGVPTPVLSSALTSRFFSQGEGDFQSKVQSAMRFAFGGHLEKKKGGA